MIKTYRKSVFVLIIPFVLLVSAFIQQPEKPATIAEMVRSIPGLTLDERRGLISALEKRFEAEIQDGLLDEESIENISHIVNAGLFEEMDPGDIAAMAYQAYIAEKNGAPAAYVEEMVYSGFATPMEASQVESSAKTLERYQTTDIDPAVYQEVIAHGLSNEWDPETVEGVYRTLVRGDELGVDTKKLALAMIIRIDQDLSGMAVEAAAQEEIALLQGDALYRSEATGRDYVFQYMQEAIKKNVNHNIAHELYYHAVGNKWSKKAVRAIFKGMIKAREVGLSPDRIALAMLIRMEQGLDSTSPKTMVNEELQFVARLERKKIDLISQDPDLDYTKPVPEDQREPVFVEPVRPDPNVRDEPEPEDVQPKVRSALNIPLMQQTIQAYLGTPYRYGGMSRYGIDCSGFTTVVYREQGLYLPRVVRKQVLVGQSVSYGGLQYGDLVFFNRWGSGSASHVGIYVGNGIFVHASSSRGVVVSQISKRYYKIRFLGGKRIV